METIRQWLWLIVWTWLILLFLRTAYILKKNFKTWKSIDIILILIIAFIIFLTLVFEFMLPSRFIQFMQDVLYLGVVVQIFYIFASKIFPVSNHKLFNKRTYTIFVIFVLLGIFVYSVIDFDNAFNWEDEDAYSGTEIHGMALNILEIIIAIGNLILAYFVSKREFKRDPTLEYDAQALRELLDQSTDLNRAKSKLWTIAIGCLICSLFRVSRSIISQLLIAYSEEYVWEQDMYFVSLDNKTNLYFWYRLMVLIFTTLFLIYVIYFIPNYQGQISHINNKQNVKIIDNEIDNALNAPITLDEHVENPQLMKKKSSATKNLPEDASDVSLGTFLANEYDPKLNKKPSTRNNKSGRRNYGSGDITDRATALN